MTTMREDFRALLLAAPGVAALVDTRIAWLRRPQGEALPGVVLTQVGRDVAYHYKGQSGLIRARVQVDIYALTIAGAEAIAQAISATVSGFRGPQGGTFFSGIFEDASRDSYEDDPAGGFARLSVDYLIHHKEL